MTAVPPQPQIPAVKVVKASAQRIVPEGLAVQVRKQQRESLQKNDCVQHDHGLSNLDFAYVLDDGHYLVVLNCWLAAYNSASLLFRLDASGLQATALQLPKNGDSVVSGAHFEKGILSSYHKGRGLGDCGGSAGWAWDGKQFVLVSMQEMPTCRGTPRFLNTWRVPVH